MTNALRAAITLLALLVAPAADAQRGGRSTEGRPLAELGVISRAQQPLGDPGRGPFAERYTEEGWQYLETTHFRIASPCGGWKLSAKDKKRLAAELEMLAPYFPDLGARTEVAAPGGVRGPHRRPAEALYADFQTLAKVEDDDFPASRAVPRTAAARTWATARTSASERSSRSSCTTDVSTTPTSPGGSEASRRTTRSAGTTAPQQARRLDALRRWRPGSGPLALAAPRPQRRAHDVRRVQVLRLRPAAVALGRDGALVREAHRAHVVHARRRRGGVLRARPLLRLEQGRGEAREARQTHAGGDVDGGPRSRRPRSRRQRDRVVDHALPDRGAPRRLRGFLSARSRASSTTAATPPARTSRLQRRVLREQWDWNPIDLERAWLAWVTGEEEK